VRHWSRVSSLEAIGTELGIPGSGAFPFWTFRLLLLLALVALLNSDHDRGSGWTEIAGALVLALATGGVALWTVAAWICDANPGRGQSPTLEASGAGSRPLAASPKPRESRLLLGNVVAAVPCDADGLATNPSS